MVFAGKVFQQIVGIPIGTNCVPLLADIQWWFVYQDTFVPGRYFRINKFSGLLNRPLVRTWKSVPHFLSTVGARINESSLYFFSHMKQNLYSLALDREETVGVSVQFHIQVPRWYIVHKQPRVWELHGPDVSRWTRDQRHHREEHFCYLLGFTSVNREGWSTSHFHLWQTRRFQFPYHKLSVPE